MSGAEPAAGQASFVDRDGNPVVFEPTAWDLHVIRCLQDVEDHPDLILDQAA